MTTLTVSDKHYWVDPKISILLVEDCPMIGEIIPEFLKEEHPDTECVLTSTKAEAIRILNSRGDFDIVFLDWNLPDWTSSGLVQLVFDTQESVVEIVWISWEPKTRKIQLSEWATSECEKTEIINKMALLRKLYNI